MELDWNYLLCLLWRFWSEFTWLVNIHWNDTNINCIILEKLNVINFNEWSVNDIKLNGSRGILLRIPFRFSQDLQGFCGFHYSCMMMMAGSSPEVVRKQPESITDWRSQEILGNQSDQLPSDKKRRDPLVIQVGNNRIWWALCRRR